MLRNNGSDDLTVNSNGSFVFDTPLPTGATYNVTIARQPTNPSQVCSVRDGAGTVAMSNVTSISVRCATTANGFLVGGRVNDLRGEGLVLQNNGADDLAIASNWRFNFSTRLPTGAFYNVTVANQPRDPDQRCEVKNGVGLIVNSNIQSVEIECRRARDED
jgi:hypothetical protein